MLMTDTVPDIRINDFVIATDLRAVPSLLTAIKALGKASAEFTPFEHRPRQVVYLASPFYAVTVAEKFLGEKRPFSELAEQPWVMDTRYLEVVHRPSFVIGDRVQLRETPHVDEENKWGWLGSKHFLIAGAHGTVYRLEFDGCSIMFDDDSWIDTKGTIRKRDKKYLFFFRDKDLEKL